ncbi:DEAH-box RNA helicase [Ophiocordyceps camponoti-floridani]|uniref:RNA helicase n=1 Tax=Ophiocordyceps camponoti-floridani TaxID=2030778 RepID=A0A8H4VC81_9HYPO|nr:DEAH-box RNA helicase [Ophiocordyceps camponoti-floridani]
MAKFVPRQRKHKVLAREKAKEKGRHEVLDTNQPVVSADKKALEEKRAQTKADLRQSGVKVSGKKAKRLEKYIDNKLRKDENRELLAKLAASKIDTSLFASSRSLGRGRETKKQALSRALREKRAGIEGEDGDDLLFERRGMGLGVEEGDETDGADDSDGTGSCEETPLNSYAPPPALAESFGVASAVVGSGLKRPLELNDEGLPIIKKRQKRGGVATKVQLHRTIPAVSEYEEWHGFESDVESGDYLSTEDVDSDEHGSEENTGEGSNSEETSDDDSIDDDKEGENKAQRSSAFKAWAQQQRNEALGYQPAGAPSTTIVPPRPESFVPRAPEQDPLPAELQPTAETDRKAFSVAVERSPEIQAARLKLPIVSEEQRLMEAIHNNDIVVICGSTGSGKTTQVPQFLFEAGYGSPNSPTPGMIGVTQPRRVAAVSMSRRVAEELGGHADAVAYQIRFEGSVDAKTAIKFMTDGVLLREVSQDIALRKYSAIIIDEAHERSVNTDILMGMLSRVVRLRAEMAREDPSLRPLKFIIMSATLRIEDLTKNSTLFPTAPPVLEIEGRQHPVTVHFSRRTQHDYVEEAFRKISRGHRKLPPGGFLVFLTGRNEITQLSKRLRAAFGGLRTAEGPSVKISANEAPVEVEDIDFGHADDGELDDLSSSDEEDEAEQEEKEFQVEEDQEAGPSDMQILPLYSLLPTREQLRVFEPAPDGSRQVILATNVAETSLTMPGIRFVFDCGRCKERRFDRVSGVQSYHIGWISKASADQRSGRAGRTGPGHCYRLYSSAVYERDFAEFSDPELLRMPIEGVVLQLKAMNLQHVVNFPFPTPPERQSLARAEKLLGYLSALSGEGRVTDVGKTMAVFPLAPRFARILLVGHLHDCLPYTVALVAALSAAEVFIPESQAVPELAVRDEAHLRTNADVEAENKQAKARKTFNEVHRNFCFLDDRSDAIKLLQVVGEFAHEPTEEWCQRHFVRFKVLKEISQLRRQLTELLRLNVDSFSGLGFQDRLPPPSAKQVSALKQMVAAGFVDRVAIRADLAPNPPEQHRKPRRAIDVPYLPLTASTSSEGDGLVYVHPSSPLAHLSTGELPEYVVYNYLQRSDGQGKKTRMQALTDVSGGQLAALVKGTPLVEYGKPIKEVRAGLDSRECWVVPYLRAEGLGGGLGWPLPARRVTQRRVPGKGWVVV